MKRTTWATVAPLVLVAGLSAAGISSASQTSSQSAVKRPSLTKVTVGVLPVADVAPLYVGIREGFFAKQHLAVEPEAFQGGAAITSAVVGGSLNFGFAAAVNMVLAKAHGLPVSIVANGDNAALTAQEAWSAILVGQGSNIKSVRQLAGATIATNAVDGVNELAVDGVLESHGVNPSSVHFVVLNFPDMPAALASGHVQAVSTSEPFVSAIKAAGGRVVSPLFEGYIPGMTVGTWIASSSELKHKLGLVERFVAAVDQSLTYARSHPSVVRDVIPSYTKIKAPIAAHMALPLFDSVVNRPSLVKQEAFMKKLGWLSSNVSISSLVWSGAAK